jgi:hypothetical protein
MKYSLLSRLMCGSAILAMATIDQSEFARFGAGDKTNVFLRVDKRVDLTMVAGATVSAQINLPAGAQRVTVSFETPTAFSGTPTNINARVGLAAAGQEVVADTDVKSQGHIAGTIVAALNQTTVAAAGVTPLYLQVAANGGTSPAGTVSVYIGYAVPAEGN